MTDETNEGVSQDLNFDQAEFEEVPEGPPRCTVCETELFGTYFEINSLATCESCRFKVEEEYHTGSASGRFFRALVGGLLAGAVGAAIWFGVQELTGYNVGLIAIVVGWLVGKAVHWGSSARGGWVYQGMAMTLTYVAIVSTFVPEIVGMMRQVVTEETQAIAEAEPGVLGEVEETQSVPPAQETEPLAPEPAEALPEGEIVPEEVPYDGLPTPVVFVLAVLFITALAMAAPFLSGSIIGLIIIGIGVYEAWRQNRKLVLLIEGPFQLNVRPPGGVPEPAEEMSPS